jgi:alpha-glucosidase/alpha-D-xyloside xylohydrolase
MLRKCSGQIAILTGFWLVWHPAISQGGVILFREKPAELSVSTVSERTVEILLAPLDEKGQPRQGSPSTVLVEQKLEEKLRCRELTGVKRIQSGKLQVQIKLNPLTITVFDSSGKLVQDLIVSADGSVTFRTEAPVLGLGEGGHQFDRRGEYHRLVNGQVAPFLATHGGTIRVPFLIGTNGWALFVHRPLGEFDLRNGRGSFIIPKGDTSQVSEPLEVYVISVHEPADALAEYRRLTGKTVMPPKWALGYMQSHRTLAGPNEITQIAKTFRDKQLPCDVLIYLGTGYCPAGWNVGHGSVAFNPKTFDHPAEMVQGLHDLNFRVVLHVNHAPRELFGASVREASDVPTHIHNYWAWHRDTFRIGVDGWWPDDGDELPVEARLARHRCYYEGPLQERPNIRPWSLHRNGYAGVQRYGGWIWSGDVQSRWATLAAHVPVGINSSLSLSPFWGTDTRGFIPTREFTGELYVRWFQFSTFTPIFRSHGRTWKLRLPWGWNTGDPGPVETKLRPDPAELHNAAVEPICRKYLELRYSLLPYNYTLTREACDTGLPMMRALWLHYPGDADAVKLGDQYLWGRDLLVAPVTATSVTQRKLYLPEGVWYDFWNNKRYSGKQMVTRSVDLETLPLFVRAGAILPLDPVRKFSAQKVTDPTTVRIYQGADGNFTLYDDDGQSLSYSEGTDTKTMWIQFRWDDATRRLTIAPDARMKQWPGGSRTFTIELAGEGAKSKVVEFRGERMVIQL